MIDFTEFRARIEQLAREVPDQSDMFNLVRDDVPCVAYELAKMSIKEEDRLLLSHAPAEIIDAIRQEVFRIGSPETIERFDEGVLGRKTALQINAAFFHLTHDVFRSAHEAAVPAPRLTAGSPAQSQRGQ